ncbi:MAG: hypothetical protein ACRDRJ_03395 [Streptosporangiaceae bacterium]
MPVGSGSGGGVLDLHWLAVRIVDRAQHAEDRDANWKTSMLGSLLFEEAPAEMT